MKKFLCLFLAIGFALPPLPGATARAGCRHVKVVAVQQQAVVAYQPAVQPYFWAVGSQLQEDAAAQRIANKVMALLAAQPQQLTAQCPDGTCPTPQTLPLTAAPDRWALVKANCAGCHSTNEKAMAYVDMTDLSLLTCEQKLACMAAVLDGKMPLKKTLDPQILGNLLGEFAGAETAHQP